MVDYRAKFDCELRDIHTSFLDLQRGNTDRGYPPHSEAMHGQPISLLLWFGADLVGIEARGFQTRWVEGNFARGDLALADLEAVASHPEVIQLEYGSRLKPLLDTSAVEIHARGDTGSPGVWTVNKATGAFGGNRGAGVLIGVIDTGIDITHEVFNKLNSKDTRILRIWDMGIDPHDGFNSPDVRWLRGPTTYGVEYKEDMINKFLQKKAGRKPIKHKDCYGHGTHVASIAAGNGQAKRNGKNFEFVGIAPEANLIVVKMFFLFKDPKRNNVELSFEELLEDAIFYIENVTAAELGKHPVVINASLGKEIGPHDGLSTSDRFLEDHFHKATNQVLVAAAGNEADSRQHAVITMPAGQTINVPFTLYDERDVTNDRAHCDEKKLRNNGAKELEIQFWYPPLPSQQTLTSALTPPGAKSPTNGPALGGSDVPGSYRGTQPFLMTHDADDTRRPPTNTPVTRNVLRVKVTRTADKFSSGPFTLRLTGPTGTIIHVWCMQNQPRHGFRIGLDNPDPDADSDMQDLPNGIDPADTSTLSYPATSAGAVAVAAYDDANTGTPIWSSSSQGPLVDYSGMGPYMAKPDIAAPGVDIEAATSVDSLLRALATKFKLGVPPYARFPGTSAAAPHVSGVAALMFEKKTNLARDDLVKAMKATARPPNTANTYGAGRVDAKKSRDAV